MPELRTERLVLRSWRDSDRAPWAAMNADPEVREHLGELLTREQSDAVLSAMRADFHERGFGWWALESRETGEFIGRAGLDVVGPDMPFAGVDVGWRLTRAAWGNGYATEAALACLAFGFETLGLPEVIATTTVRNLRSQAVMRRIGMTRNPADDFEDPSVPEGPLRPCVLYRISREDARGPQTASPGRPGPG
ncbi:GNAT family N-acetyltransferase [Streptomyces sp. NBC_00233]|uniref:GNAT family N-acetyltransferase n=1 Tax=Streptomyces sp. NBC_00233 TaxID=2975686 RepID=UPI0022509CD6|nr:GNAT family N-acetyltransferase [Streptomyces sp. NBC_00233]MCX5231576.1 GNAT family N-acetyltransferase [Streptomyces sp. NBC_00233]